MKNIPRVNSPERLLVVAWKSIVFWAMASRNSFINGHSIEFRRRNIPLNRDQEMDTIRGENIGTRRVDFFVEGKVMVELKAIIHLEDVHLAQAINYLEAYGLETGLLVNFGAKSLEFKRVMKPLNKSQSVNKSL
jgi:GxxExxY protein